MSNVHALPFIVSAISLVCGVAHAQPAPADMLTLRLEDWKSPVRIERIEANRIIHTAFVKHGFGGWIPMENVPDFFAFRGDSTGLSPPDPSADMISIDLSEGADGEMLAHMKLASMRPAADGFVPAADLSDTPEAKAIFADIAAALLAAR